MRILLIVASGLVFIVGIPLVLFPARGEHGAGDLRDFE
jgi:hypothetical protein